MLRNIVVYNSLPESGRCLGFLPSKKHVTLNKCMYDEWVVFLSYMKLNCGSLNNIQLYLIIIHSHTPCEGCRLVKIF